MRDCCLCWIGVLGVQLYRTVIRIYGMVEQGLCPVIVRLLERCMERNGLFPSYSHILLPHSRKRTRTKPSRIEQVT
jgi:hypothetical protein